MPFRSLHNDLLRYNGESAWTDVLKPWLETHAAELEWLRSFKERTGRPIPSASEDELWRLYAASRAFELLVLRFQNGRADGSDWPGPPVSESVFEEFSRSVGFDVLRPNQYASFYHEVVELSPAADRHRSIQIRRFHWPCLMLGALLFMRAGVTVAADSRAMAPGIADRSTLYWAYRRKNRLHQDLSHGWGSNSQWRTLFRRDYHLDDVFHFNVDAKVDLCSLHAEARNDDGLSADERMELVANRCFVLTTQASDDLFPYDDRFSMKAK